jgi:hypothetical protein
MDHHLHIAAACPALPKLRPVDPWRIIPGALDEHDVDLATFIRNTRDMFDQIKEGRLNPEHDIDWRAAYEDAARMFELITD